MGGLLFKAASRRGVAWAVLAGGAAAGAVVLSQLEGTPVAPCQFGGTEGLQRLWVDGCREQLLGGVCQVAEGDRLTVWVPRHAGEHPRLELGGRPLVLEHSAPVQEGVRFRFSVQEFGALCAEHTDIPLQGVELVRHQPNPRLEQARAHRRAGDPQRAHALVEQERTEGDTLRAESLAARLLLDKGRFEEAARGLARTSQAAWLRGRVSQALDDAFALSFLHTQRLDRPSKGIKVLAEAQDWLPHAPAQRRWFDYFRGVAAMRLGDWAGARAHFDVSMRHSARSGEPVATSPAAQNLATVYARLGRTDAALELLQKALSAEGLSPCVRASFHADLGWIAFLAAEVGHASAQHDPHYHFEQARLRDGQCENETAPRRARARRNGLINLALWAVHAEDWVAASHWLAALAEFEGGQSTEYAIWEEEARGRLAMSQSQHALAEQHFARQWSLARASNAFADQSRALLWRGAVRLRAGALGEAVDFFQRSDVVGLQGRGTPLFGSARVGALAQQDLAARYLVESLVDSGRIASAYNAARRTWGRAFGARSTGARVARLPASQRARWQEQISDYLSYRSALDKSSSEDWRLTRAQLEAKRAQRATLLLRGEQALSAAWRLLGTPEEASTDELQRGELILLVFPGFRHWLGFARGANHTTVRRIAEDTRRPPPETQLADWLASLAAQLRGAKRLSLMPYGKAGGIDWAALPYEGRSLAESLPIAYRLGMRADAPAASTAHEALIVGDPLGDLPRARAEALFVGRSALGGTNRLLLGSEATHAAVTEALPTAGFFHYSGHSTSATDDWSTGLRLAGGTWLAPSDVLALKRVPPKVVLAACDAGSGSSLQWTSGWSLAHAFVGAGAQQVVAPVRRIQDESAERFERLLYEALADSPDHSLVHALARAQGVAQKTGLEDWQVYRAFTP